MKWGDTFEKEVGRAMQRNNFFNRFDHPNSFTPYNTAPPTAPSALSVPPGTTLSTEKNVPPPMLTAVQFIFNLSLEQEKVPGGWSMVEDAIVYMLYQSLSHLDRESGSVQEEEYRKLIQDFVVWCEFNCLHLYSTKIREMVVDLRGPRPQPEPVTINEDYAAFLKNLGVQLDGKLDWNGLPTRKGKRCLYFLRKLSSFYICKKLL
ncbi:protein turtle homolog B-like [Tachysurus ichikawai]